MRNYTYYNTRTKATTARATEALQWHNAGDNLEVWKKGATVRILGAQIEKPDFEDECRDQCKHIAEEVNAYAAGSVHICPECGEEIIFPDGVGDKFKCPHCGEVNDADDFDEATIYDYLSDSLDWEYRVTRDKEYRSCEICVGWGGPNIYIDTADAYVHLYWGNTQTQYPITYEARDALDEACEEYFNM